MLREADNDNRQWLTRPNSPDAALPDWIPDIERLKREAQSAKESGRPDPWSLAEAECWRDLIGAEIAAQTHRGAGADVLQVLRGWERELGTVIRMLGSRDHGTANRSERAEQSVAA